MSQGANKVNQGAGSVPKAKKAAKRALKIAEKKRLSAEIDRKLKLLGVLGKKKIGEITQKEFDEYRRLAREVIDDMLRSMKP